MWKIIIILGIILLGFGAAIGTYYKTKLIPTLFVLFSVIFFTVGMIDLITLYKSKSTTMDIYHSKTILEITSVNECPKDSVVFKDKKK